MVKVLKSSKDWDYRSECAAPLPFEKVSIMKNIENSGVFCLLVETETTYEPSLVLIQETDNSPSSYLPL